MSNYWVLKCSCGEEVPDEGVNHGDDTLLAILKARPQIEALRATGVTFQVETYQGSHNGLIDCAWFSQHDGEGHVVHLEDEHGKVRTE